jgi:hypothetical protein
VLEKLVKNLVERRLVVPVADPLAELDRQRRSLASLIARSERGSLASRFLAEYDALMRICEILLVQQGYIFGSMPHATMNFIVSAIDPTSNIRRLSKLRHGVKKGFATPQLVDVESVHSLRISVSGYVVSP